MDHLTTNVNKRSRSLSPCCSGCLCYNCNVSQLIVRSRDLPARERSNFMTYFARSLSHKFFDCSCCLSYRFLFDRVPCSRSRSPLRRCKDAAKRATRCHSCPASFGQSTNHFTARRRHSYSSFYVGHAPHPLPSTSSSTSSTPPATHEKEHRHARPRAPPLPTLQPQRSFSSPDTRPSIIQPDPTCTARRHRHSISGHMSYFKLLGYNVAKKLAGSANSLFSTAVISGSSSAPNLKDMVPSHASVATIEGFGGVPPIRPLETLHNALSLRQLDTFLDLMTSAPLFRTPASSPPKSSSTSLNQQNFNSANVGHCDIDNTVRYVAPTPIRYKISCDTDSCDARNQPSPTSPNSVGWSSEAQSFPSSEPSSPAPTSTGECSMSVSLISNDGAGAKFSATSSHFDLDFNDFYMNVDQESHESRGSVSYTDYYSNEDGQIRKGGELVATTSYAEEPPADSVDDDEEHTLTLRRAEELKKQNVKMLFEQTQCPPPTKMTIKKIGRFRVESMDISDEDVRIKESNSSLRTSTWRNTSEAQPSKRKSLSRSQSVSTPKASLSVCDSGAFKCSCTEQSFSAFSAKDADAPEEPVLTVASSLTDSSSVIIGFDVQNDRGEDAN